MPEIVRCAVIGAGGFAETCHIPGLQSHPHARVVALCGRNLDNCRAMAERHGIPDAVADYREVVGRPDIDAVAIVTPNVSHHPIAMAALAAGKHVFCEKPLAIDAAQARDMEAAAERFARVAQVAFTFRFLHGLEAFRRALRDGAVGRPGFARIRFEWSGDLRPDATIGWRHLKEESGAGGMLQDMGSHCLDLVNYALEPAAEACGLLVTVPRTRRYGKTGEMREVTTDDVAACFWRAASGLQGEWTVSRLTTLQAGNSEIEVIGEQGVLRAALSRGRSDGAVLERPGREPEALPLPDEPGRGTDYALGRMMRAFVDAVLGRPRLGPEASFSDGRLAQEGVDAILRSVAERRWIRLEPER